MKKCSKESVDNKSQKTSGEKTMNQSTSRTTQTEPKEKTMRPNATNANGDVNQTDYEFEATDNAAIESQDASEQSDATGEAATVNGTLDGDSTEPCLEMTGFDRCLEGETEQCDLLLEGPGSQPLSKPVDEMMARCLALGFTCAETARTVNRSVETVYRRRKDPEFIARVNALRDRIVETNSELVNKLLRTAVHRACDFINDPEFEVDQLDTLLGIIDRFVQYRGEIPDFD